MQMPDDTNAAVMPEDAQREKVKTLLIEANRVVLADPHRCKTLMASVLELIGDEPSWVEERARAFQLLGDAHRRIAEYDTALKHYHDAVALYQSVGKASSVAYNLHQIATIHVNASEYLTGLKFADESHDLYRSLNDRKGIGISLNMLGNIYMMLSDYPTALTYHQESLDLTRETGDDVYLAPVICNVGLLKIYTKKFQEAIDLLDESVRRFQAINDTQGEAIAIINLGEAHQRLGNYADAITCFRQGLTMFERLGNTQGIAYGLTHVAQVHCSLGEFDKAVVVYHESLVVGRSVAEQSAIVSACIGLGEAQMHLKNFPESEAALYEALELSRKNHFKQDEAETLKMYAALYAEMQAFDKAYDYHQAFYQVEKEIFNIESERQLSALQVRFDTEQAKKQARIEREKSAELAAALDGAERERQNAERERERAEQANRFKSDLLNLAAHDLKNPLQVILGYASLVGESNSLDECNQFASDIKRGAARMLSLIQELLENNQLEQGQLKLDCSECSLRELMLSVIDNLRSTADAKGQTVYTHFQIAAPLYADAGKLSQVFENLITNAIKYSPRNTTITVRIESRDGRVGNRSAISNVPEASSSAPLHTSFSIHDSTSCLISVKDEGLGLTEKDKEKLFGKFQRLSARPTGGESSTGLGLSIVKEIVELHGGNVWAESEGKNKGTTFFVELPVLV
jgi:signal transduction histidine kinase